MIRPDFREIKHSNELYHYGMPRRSGRYPWGSGKKPYQDVKNALKSKKRGEYFTSERTIEKGTPMYRTTSNPSSAMKPGEATYVTYLEPDRDLYKGGHIRLRDGSEVSYEHTMMLNEDLKIPSRETFKTALKESIKENPKLLKESVESYLNMYVPENSFDRFQIEYDEETGKIDKSRWDKFVKDSYITRSNIPVEEQWGSIAVSLGTSDQLKSTVIKKLKSKGYNAMVDEAGVGGSGRIVEGVDPLIIFDSSVLTMTSTNKISQIDETRSRRDYLKWVNKVRGSGGKREW